MYENPYSTGYSEHGGYGTVAVMFDGGLLCFGCATSPTNPVKDWEGGRPDDADPSDDQWAVIGWDDAGSYGDTLCAYCNGPT